MINQKDWNNFEELFKSIHIDKEFVNVKGSTISFTIQNGPIKEVGINGTQIDSIGKVWLAILQSFQDRFPCRENAITITKIEEALMWQEARTKNRIKRNVEGKDLK